MSRVSAFFFSGRFSVSVSTPAVTSVRTWSVIAFPLLQGGSKPLPDDAFCLGHDPIDQLAHGRDVVNQPGHHAARPGTGIHVATLHDPRIDAGQLGCDIGERDRGTERALFLEHAI